MWPDIGDGFYDEAAGSGGLHGGEEEGKGGEEATGEDCRRAGNNQNRLNRNEKSPLTPFADKIDLFFVFLES